MSTDKLESLDSIKEVWLQSVFRFRFTSADTLGAVELTGFELEVADAARKAGFNTFSQDALFELIWAVKRVALRRGGVHWNTVARGPRYQDPIYPDRYRPSGIGDNTKKRRKAIAIKSAPSNFGKVQFHPIKPLMRKRPLHNIAEEHLIDLTSSDNEIDLTSRPTTTSKRQKMAAVNDRPKNTILQIDYGRAGNMGPAVKPKPTCKPAHVQNTPSVSGPSPSNIPPATMTSRQEIVKQLKLVKTKLEDARRNMNICQASMKTLFDLHYDEFDSDEMMMSLQKLSNFMNKVFDGGKDGAGEVDNAIVLLNANKGKMR